MRKPQILIGAASSGSGKTTFSLGIMRIFRNKGLNVQPFKCGPDYIDTKHHALAAGNDSVNLDSFLGSNKHVCEVYSKYGSRADICITEGVMGLFDGYEGVKGSSAEIAMLLDIPVILLINGKSTSYTVAPIIYGFKNFNPHLRLAGVVFNFVSSESHYNHLEQACKDVGVECFGYIKKDSKIAMPSRHLGLTLDKDFLFDDFAEQIAKYISKTVDVERILEVCTKEFPMINSKIFHKEKEIKISVARDEAFGFAYKENLEKLHELGEVSFFSPLNDSILPETDLLYLPGGYPEFYLPLLSGNVTMIESIRAYCKKGGRCLAECGGMMYLCENIISQKGKRFPMVGIFSQDATMENMRLRLGYRKILLKDIELRGHEFHYSGLVNDKEVITVGKVQNASGVDVDTLIFKYKNTIGSYIHFYWGEDSVSILNALLYL